MIITDHAAEQYIKRIKKKIDIDKAKEEIEELFMEAELEKSSAALVIRKIKNGFQGEEYYRNKQWRFIVCKDIIITIEIDKFKDTSLGYMKKKNL